jgi:hypothetical protein
MVVVVMVLEVAMVGIAVVVMVLAVGRGGGGRVPGLCDICGGQSTSFFQFQAQRTLSHSCAELMPFRNEEGRVRPLHVHCAHPQTLCMFTFIHFSSE